MNTLERKIIQYLNDHPDGVLETKITIDLREHGAHRVSSTLNRMFGVYIDRWAWSSLKGSNVPVYKVVSVPPDAVKPEEVNVELSNNRRIVTRDIHAAYLLDKRIDRSFVNQQ